MSVQYFPFLALAGFQKIVPQLGEGNEIAFKKRFLGMNVNIVMTLTRKHASIWHISLRKLHFVVNHLSKPCACQQATSPLSWAAGHAFTLPFPHRHTVYRTPRHAGALSPHCCSAFLINGGICHKRRPEN